jgi:hypothetical protein
MFKRALQTNHWMTIGLDEWNKLENMDISVTKLQKLRKVERGEEVDDDEESEHTISDEESDDCSEDVPVEEDCESEDEVSSIDGDRVFLRYCEACPGRKFLTEKDFQEHINSKKHQKRLAKENEPTQSDSKPAITIPTPTKQTESTVSKPTNPNNRKARRAHLASTVDTNSSH